VAGRRKLIEVSIPLDEINKQSAREKSIRHGHPSTLHLWWARRPLATARAVLFAQLVDDPSAREAEFITEARENGHEDPEAWAEHRIKQERERLFSLITRMVNWDNLGDEALFEEVRAEIQKSTGGSPPPILDPFAGGGTIPLEAQRLGLEAHAADLNPVAVLINKALIEIPPQFAGCAPVYPEAATARTDWPKASGLAEDVRRYGEWMRDEAQKRIGRHYPKAEVSGLGETPVIAWIWARTVSCPNPACGIEMPLVRSWWLGKRKGKEAYIVPLVTGGRVEYSIGHDPELSPTKSDDGTVGRTGATCISCGTAVPLEYIREAGRRGDMGAELMAVVAEGSRSRIYIAPTAEHREAAEVDRPADLPVGGLPEKALSFRVQAYGMTEWVDLFTNRQLVALTTFSDLVEEVRERILADARAAGRAPGLRLEKGGNDAEAYADAVSTYLAMAVSRVTDYVSALSTWSSHPKNEVIVHVFGRQAIPMVWEFAESNPLGNGNGSFVSMTNAIARALDYLPASGIAEVRQADATTSVTSPAVLISTDPPYYDNIGYSDLSDYFYVWLRRSLRTIHPELLSTLLVPKSEELVANPYRHRGRDGARKFFEAGFRRVFENARAVSNESFPITVYYAFKQSETDESGTASTGWETILASIVRAGWTVTATWPVRSEFAGRMVSNGTNALASSVVLALRPRADSALVTDRRGFIGAMKRELAPALRDLQHGGIAPVDLRQSAIGPGMAVFSRYAKVIESDGSEMTVRAALTRINDVLDELLAEQEGDFDSTTRFALAWYRSNGYESGPYDDAEKEARARATAVSAMERSGVLSARAGRVQLYRPSDLPENYDVGSDQHTSAWEALHHAIRIQESMGIPAAGAFLEEASRRPDGAVDLDLVKELAYLLFQIAEKNGWTKDAISFNGVATSWSELLELGRTAPAPSTPTMLDFDALDG